MEQYVYFSIVFFSLIIFSLYIYIIYEKIAEVHKIKKIEKYKREVTPYVNFNINKVINGQDITSDILKNIKRYCKNKYKREIIRKRLVYYLENFKGDFSQNITKVCEYIGIVQYEINNFQHGDNFKKALSAKRLGQFRSKNAIEPLLEESDIADNDVKYNILLALAKIGEEETFIRAFENVDSSVGLSERGLIEIVDSFEGDKNKIYKKMIHSDNSLVARVFIKSAGNYKHASLSRDISKYLFSEDKERRIAAVKAIGSIGDARYLDDVIKLLKDSEWEVRAVTAKSMNNFTNSKILIPLARSLSDNKWYVRYNAAMSILNYEKEIGMSIISYAFQRKDKFVRNIIISAIENSSNNKLYLYETSKDNTKRAVECITMGKKDEEYEYNVN